MNERKLFPEKKTSKKGILEFLDKKGFYIVLILCIAIVGVAAVLLSTNTITSQGTDSDTQIIPHAYDSGEKAVEGDKTTSPKVDQSAITSPAASSEPKAVTGADNKSTTAVAGSTIALNESKKEGKPQQNKAAQTGKKLVSAKKDSSSEKFIMPVFGDVTFEYAQDKLVYSKTLEDWRTHDGVDLAADRGAPVKAVADGVISEIKGDPRYGIMVYIDHGNGTKTVYANLASDEMVTPNQKVKQGDVIGAVGSTAAFESSERSHLHFEVWKNNKLVDPKTYLPEK
ncbi:MAG: M23 family metallopeptidase [Clostridia bacterium]|nr:M23 family metallopeptidase [Clostridia bacterium]